MHEFISGMINDQEATMAQDKSRKRKHKKKNEKKGAQKLLLMSRRLFAR
jgi:hypothetical protein